MSWAAAGVSLQWWCIHSFTDINCVHSFSHMKSIYLLIYFCLEVWLCKWQQVRKCCRRWSAAAVTASHPCSSLCLMNLCLKWLKEAFGHLNFHSLWKFLLCDTIQDFTEKNGNAKDSWKATNHHYVSFTDLSLLHDPFFSGYVDNSIYSFVLCSVFKQMFEQKPWKWMQLWSHVPY